VSDTLHRASSRGPWRVGFCLPWLQPIHLATTGQLTRQAYIQQGYIATGLQARGHSLTFLAECNVREIVCTQDLDRPLPAPLTWSGTRGFELASKATWRLQRWLGVPYLNVFSNYRLLDAALHCLPGHDLVQERVRLYRSGVAMACKRLGIPYVVFFDADEILERDFAGTPITGLLRWRAVQMMRRTLGIADRVICVTEETKGHLVAQWDVPAERIAVFPNGVDIKHHRPDPESRLEVRASLGMDDAFVVIFVGRFYRWHDVTTLLQAFAEFAQHHPQAHLLLVGDGDERGAMEQLALGLGLGRRVSFTGLVSHTKIPQLVSAADVAVAPYPPMEQDLWSSPMKLFEYMASGTAVVASNLGQIAKVLQDGVNGLLVPPGDASALASALVRLHDDAGLRSELGRQAREDAVRKHSWVDYVLRLERLYTAVIHGHAVGSL
jgi:glycosyltransferase involved in cell wall biosynthesis